VQTQNNLKQLEHKINNLKSHLNRDQGKHQQLEQQLNTTQKNMSDGLLQLKKIQIELLNKQNDIQALRKKIESLLIQLKIQQQGLADFVRAHYQTGEYQKVQWLLNQNQIQKVDRLLTYYRYLEKARGRSIQLVIESQQQLELNQKKLQVDLIALKKIEEKFGATAAQNILEMTKIKLKRKIIEEPTPV
jgi:septal ring factor EnvC (AmiA/AmiB activator)